MGIFRRHILVNALRPLDLVLIVLSFGAASAPVLVTEGLLSFAEFMSLRIKLQNLVLLALLLWLWHLVFSVTGLYDSKRLASRRAEALDVIKATSICILILICFGALLRLRLITPGFVVIFWATSTLTAVTSRFILRTWLRSFRAHGYNSRNMLIVGSNSRAIEFAKRMSLRSELGYRVIGFADDEWAGIEDLRTSGFARVCDFAGLPTFLRRNVVDEVVVALPIRSFHQRASRVAAMCEEQGIIVRLLSDLFNLKTARPLAQDLDGAELITQYMGPAEGWPAIAKRLIDITLSTVLLVVLSPLMAVASILIKLTSTGPVLFVQKRIGLNKRLFNIYKFRTMVVGAEKRLADLEHLNEVSGPVFKIKNDPRVTPLGAFLRKTSVDELPQLFNILNGDMSLVGPRPLQLRDYELFTQGGEDWQRCRFSVRPGITCLWQVNGRSSIPFEKWMELDLQYVRKWSLWLDLQILVRTIPAVLKGSGAA